MFADVGTPSGGRVRTWTTGPSGTGPPVLLLHGWPQTSAAWHLVAPALARTRAVVCADLPGYGDSPLPADADVAVSGKRTMAADLVAVMAELGHARFAVAGHDRGARVGYRLALDHPDRVTALAVMDIIPTLDVAERVDVAFARAAWHWFLLAQPVDLPERLLAADSDALLGRGLHVCAPDALAAYREAWSRPEVRHGMCQDYRAGWDVDVETDRADRGVRTIDCPTLVLWGEHGPLGRAPDVMDVWRRWAPAAQGIVLPCGHFVPEERPDDVAAAILALLAA
ncbi:MAG: alpha/beta hydrolase [Pseudonocardia sp.]|nr:alpha/beta hydrolase [Pseudonocardia sp.]ODU12880.1 MAG: alpha/beta hydrolase [Pseudonocardia sp. SCN 72-51]ODV08330.1 MAG: alpha/beta hydrolase [Pseudonocardia sp. SCN 73-27]